MKPLSLLFSLFFIATFHASGQTLRQYFDGADTIVTNSLFITLDTNNNNVWQIGPPQKTHFNSAATTPNVLVTDTINAYPARDTASFWFSFKPTWAHWGILAIQWKQKLDMDYGHDGGIIEFSTDGGTAWQNVFDNPLVYNFYGFDTANTDTLVNGQPAFTGTDTLWKDIWLCFDVSFFSIYDSVMVRYTLLSDSVDSVKEGWMIDNMMARLTVTHTAVKLTAEEEYMKVFPTITSGRLNIEAEKLN